MNCETDQRDASQTVGSNQGIATGLDNDDEVTPSITPPILSIMMR